MPAASKRRRVSGPPAAHAPSKAAAPAQSTISFGGRVTKPSARADAKAKQAELTTKAKAATVATKLDVQHTAPPPVAEIEEPERESHDPEGDEVEEAEEDVAARAISTAQISRYWAAKERARKAPRVHQQDLGTAKKVLREFDMESRFGVRSVPYHVDPTASERSRECSADEC